MSMYGIQRLSWYNVSFIICLAITCTGLLLSNLSRIRPAVQAFGPPLTAIGSRGCVAIATIAMLVFLSALVPHASMYVWALGANAGLLLTLDCWRWD